MVRVEIVGNPEIARVRWLESERERLLALTNEGSPTMQLRPSAFAAVATGWLLALSGYVGGLAPHVSSRSFTDHRASTELAAAVG